MTSNISTTPSIIQEPSRDGSSAAEFNSALLKSSYSVVSLGLCR